MDTGRRALPPESPSLHHPPTPAPRRGLVPQPAETRPLSGTARRGLAAPLAGSESRRAWLLLAAMAALMALVIFGLYALVGPRTSTSASPAASAPNTSRVDVPSASPSVQSSLSPSTGASPFPATVTPGDSAGSEVDLGDAQLTVPAGWEVYADEVVQDNRRLVRLREPVSDVRVQAVTLTTVGDDLTQACRDLVADQRQAFTQVAESVVVDVPVTDGASGVSCAFTGVRTADAVAAKVEFTIVRREVDTLALVFRDTVPSSVPATSPVLTQLTIMECAATETFGVVIGSC